MAFLERPHHGLASGPAHHVDHRRGIHGIAAVQGKMRHDARGRGAVIGKIALLQRADRSAHDKARDPGAISGAALGAAAIGQRTARKHHAT